MCGKNTGVTTVGVTLFNNGSVAFELLKEVMIERQHAEKHYPADRKHKYYQIIIYICVFSAVMKCLSRKK